jgi:hypothetical protein
MEMKNPKKFLPANRKQGYLLRLKCCRVWISKYQAFHFSFLMTLQFCKRESLTKLDVPKSGMVEHALVRHKTLDLKKNSINL